MSLAPIFNEQMRQRLHQRTIPKHIAFIPDGNRRWALQKGTSISQGHQQGGNSLITIAKAATELDIETLTFYLFSTENWNRSPFEVNHLMELLHDFLIEQLQTMLEYGIRLQTIGILEPLPDYVQNTIAKTKVATANSSKIEMVLALNYGARDELCRTFRRLGEKIQKGELTPGAITEELISKHLDTAPWRDPELLIRTSGEMRISNYLLWQLSYSEIYVTSVLWPDFQPEHFFEAILNYQNRHRRLGN